MFRQLSQTSGVLLIAMLATILPCSLQAGAILLPGRLVDGAFVAEDVADEADATDAANLSYTIRYSTIAAEVDGPLATVSVRETIVANGAADNSSRLVCLIPLPRRLADKAVRVSLGKPNEELSPATDVRVIPASEAQALFESIAKATDSVKILALSGRPVAVIPRFKLEDKVELAIEFVTRVGSTQDVSYLDCPMPAVDWTDGPVARLSLTATLKTAGGEPLRAVFSPTHEAVIQRDGADAATVRVKSDAHTANEDFRLVWVADGQDLGLRLLSYRSEQDDDGYFLLFGNPTGSDSGKEPIAKDVTFVLDTSGSMRGEKIEQARAAIEYCLDQLNPRDRFNLVTFGTEVASFRETLVERTDAHIDAARDFVDEIVARGRTNIAGALETTLAGQPDDDRPRITIFLTDGTPTAGELVPDRIVEQVQRANQGGSRVFVLGVGHDVNAHLLDKLAEATDGSSEYVEPNQEIDAKVASLYDRLSHPVLTEAVVSFGEMRTHSVYPKTLPALFKGTEFMIAGRYRDGGRHTVIVSGLLSGEAISYTCVADLPMQSPDGPGTDVARVSNDATEFVAPLWAARKIGYLLQEIRLHGENEELLEEVVRLSRKFGVVTEYTEFIASGDVDLSDEVVLNEARRRMNSANGLKAGKWAFNQAVNDRQLQQRLVTNGQANTFRDRSGRVVANDNVRQIGGQAFYLRDGQWVEAEGAEQREEQVVELYSEEYFDLLHNNAQFARAQQLGWAVSMNVGDQRVSVARNGEQKSEELRQQVQQRVEERQQQLNEFQNGRQLQQRGQILQNGFNQQIQMPLQQLDLNNLRQQRR